MEKKWVEERRKDLFRERRDKFHKAFLNLYHPPSPPESAPSPPPLAEEEIVSVVFGDRDLNLHQDAAESDKSSGHSNDSESKKLTRAQRKRIRKRKLKEVAAVRRKIIGPLLPASNQTPEGVLKSFDLYKQEVLKKGDGEILICKKL